MTQKDNSKIEKKPVRKRAPTPKPAKVTKPSAAREPMSSDEMRSAKSKIRMKKRRRNKLIATAVVILLCVAAAVVLLLTVFFKTQNIKVTGDEIYNTESIIEASDIKIGENMFLFDKDNVSESIEKNLPYVEKAVIKRSPTGTVTINITAAKAVLALDMGDSYVLVSASGKVLEDGVMAINDDVTIIKASNIVTAAPGGKLVFENKDDLTTLVNAEQMIIQYEIPHITSIDVTDYSNVKLTYDHRITLEIGKITELSNKIDFIKATLKKQDADVPAFEGTINFTIENKAYINENDETSTSPASVVSASKTAA